MAAQFLLKLAEQHNCPRLVVEVFLSLLNFPNEWKGVLNEMFVLPTSHSKLVFYTGVLISLIKESPESSKEFVTKIVKKKAPFFIMNKFRFMNKLIQSLRIVKNMIGKSWKDLLNSLLILSAIWTLNGIGHNGKTHLFSSNSTFTGNSWLIWIQQLSKLCYLKQFWCVLSKFHSLTEFQKFFLKN